MPISSKRTAAQYRLQAAHLREFLATVHDEQLHSILLDAALRFERLAEEAALGRFADESAAPKRA
jgi:hypothetical protein